TAAAVTIEPTDIPVQKPEGTSPRLEYVFTVFKGGELKIDTYLSPTLNFKKGDGLKFAISIDDETPQIININEGEDVPDWEYPAWWNNAVGDHIRIKRSIHKDVKPGVHTLKVWLVDSGLVFQKFVIDSGGLRPSYLGPPESVIVRPKEKTGKKGKTAAGAR